MKVFRNIALLLLFSISTTSFAGIENLRILTAELCDDEDMHAAADAFTKDEYLKPIEKSVHTIKPEKHSVNPFKVGAGILSGKWAFAYREIMGDKSKSSSEKEVRKIVEYRKVPTNKLKAYTYFYVDQFQTVEKILDENSTEKQVEQIKELPENKLILLIELASFVSTNPSYFSGLISRTSSELFLDLIAKKIIMPIIEGLYSRDTTIEESYNTIGRMIKKNESTLNLNSLEKYIKSLVVICIKENNYPQLEDKFTL